MSNKDFHQKRDFVHTEHKLGKVHYAVLIGLLVINLLHNIFLDAQILGHDTRYGLYIIAIPLILGLLFTACYRRKFIWFKLNTAKGALLKSVSAGFYLLEGVFFSFLSFVFLAHAIWNYENKTIAGQNPSEIIHCKVDKFVSGKNPAIDFRYQNRSEAIKTDYQTIREFKGEDPHKCELEITVQKGIWNYYIIKGWTVNVDQ